MKKLPKTIFIQIDGDGKDEWFNANTEIAELDDGKVGVYELKEVQTRRTEHHLE